MEHRELVYVCWRLVGEGLLTMDVQNEGFAAYVNARIGLDAFRGKSESCDNCYFAGSRTPCSRQHERRV